MGKYYSQLKCSFCNKNDSQANKIIAGPGVYICNECVGSANVFLENSKLISQKGGKFQIGKTPEGKCDFCERDKAQIRYLLVGDRRPNTTICNECVDLCNEVLDDEIFLLTGEGDTGGNNTNRLVKCSFCNKDINSVEKMIASSEAHICNECVGLSNDILIGELPTWEWKNSFLTQESERSSNDDDEKIVRSLEFPPEHRDAGTSILTYFSHILRVKYPGVDVKVRIEQDGLTLRMIINTPTGQKEKIERTLVEYGLVVLGKMPADLFLSDPIEVMALRNKIDIVNLELRHARDLLKFNQDNNQDRINSLEGEMSRLHALIERAFHSKDKTMGVIDKMTTHKVKSYDFRGARFGGGFANEGGFQTGGVSIDISSTSDDLSEAAQKIQELLRQIQTEGRSLKEAQQQVAEDLSKQAKNDPIIRSKLVKWSKSLVDTAAKDTISEAAKDAMKLGLRMAGIPMP